MTALIPERQMLIAEAHAANASWEKSAILMKTARPIIALPEFVKRPIHARTSFSAGMNLMWTAAEAALQNAATESTAIPTMTADWGADARNLSACLGCRTLMETESLTYGRLKMDLILMIRPTLRRIMTRTNCQILRNTLTAQIQMQRILMEMVHLTGKR